MFIEKINKLLNLVVAENRYHFTSNQNNNFHQFKFFGFLTNQTMRKGRKITQSNSNNFCLLRTQQPDNVEGKDKRQQTNLDEDNTNALIGY